MKVQPIMRLGFSEGNKPTFDPSAIPPGTLWSSLNVRIDESGIIRIRTGSEPFYESFGPGIVQGIRSSFGKLLKAWNRNLYLVDENTGVSTQIATDVIGETESDQVELIRWARDGAEICYAFTGHGIYETDGTSTILTVPYAPDTGEEHNLIRASDGTQSPDSGPSKCRFAVLRASLSQRLAVAGNPDSPNTVFLSEPLDATYFPADQVIQLPDDGGYITGLANWYNALIIFRNTDIWAFFGSDLTDAGASLVLQDSSTGCVAGRSIAVVPEIGIMFKGSDNIYALTGVSGIENQVKAIPMADEILIQLHEASEYGHHNVNAVYYNREYRIAFPDSVEKYRVFVFSTKRTANGFQGWFMDSGPTTSQFVVHNDKLYAAKIGEGKIIKFTKRLLDDGEAIPLEIYFRREDCQPGPARIKKIFIYVLSKGRIKTTELFFLGSSFNDNLYGEEELDQVRISTATDQTLVVTAIADGMTYTVDNFTVLSKQLTFADLDKAEPVRIYQSRFSPSMKGNFLQIRISGTVPEEDISIIGYGIEYSPRGRIHGITEGVQR